MRTKSIIIESALRLAPEAPGALFTLVAEIFNLSTGRNSLKVAFNRFFCPFSEEKFEISNSKHACVFH